ncbi:MAG: aminopeptidase, partial [Bacilli bacterium]|nr:aminopeptidase [Bacilli bacterium]
GVNPVLLHDLSKWLEKQIAVFRDKQMKGEVPWCIAAVANPFWAKKIMPNSGKPLDDLWQLIFDICFVTCENPESEWEHYLHCLEERGNILNQMNIKSLHYQSSNGTDLMVELPENYVFASANMSSNVVNMPSLEIFTTPKSKSTEGIVYATKPLVYQSVFISNFWLKFKNGKVIDYGAEEGFDMLKEIVETDEGSHFLGEVALVDYDSRINQSGIIFENTLYDENASCHLALGRGFPECFLDGLQKSVADLQEMGMNYSETHVDFMIGARDLEIVACLRDGTEIVLMKQGKLIF